MTTLSFIWSTVRSAFGASVITVIVLECLPDARVLVSILNWIVPVPPAGIGVFV